jgi:hypothetical protein
LSGHAHLRQDDFELINGFERLGAQRIVDLLLGSVGLVDELLQTRKTSVGQVQTALLRTCTERQQQASRR